MLTRHKVPTIFNIYMLDVICCALGCVILLWQVAHQEAETQTNDAKKQYSAAEDSRKAFEKARDDLKSASTDVIELQASVKDWKGKYNKLSQDLAQTEKDRDAARKIIIDRTADLDKLRDAVTLSKEQLAKLQADLAKWLAVQQKTSAALAGMQKVNLDLLARLALADKEIASLRTDVKARQADIDAANKKTQGQAELVRLSQEDAKRLQKLLDTLNADNKNALDKIKLTELQLKVREQDLDRTKKELQLVLTTRDQLAKDLVAASKVTDDAKSILDAIAKDREQAKKDLEAAAKIVATLRLDKETLMKRLAALEADVEQRFAGIPLTGENVVFLIDISGSMMMKDPDTEDPDKWPFLCETLMKLMKSIPTLQRFQVILFSDKTNHLFGNRDFWLKYEGPATAEKVRDSLRKVKVEGNTNMHDGFDEAFRYRKLKLDTIYFFSDGLPNAGPGVPFSIAKPTEAQKAHYMSKHVRDKLKSDWNAPQDGMRDVRVNAVGFWFDSPDVGAFLWALAREHKGSFVGLR